MKKLILSVVTILAVVLLVNAQPPKGEGRPGGDGERPSCEEMTEMRIKMLDEKLNLSDDQKDQVSMIYSDMCKEECDDMRSSMKKADESVKSLLTDDQKEIFDKMKDEKPRGGRR